MDIVDLYSYMRIIVINIVDIKCRGKVNNKLKFFLSL